MTTFQQRDGRFFGGMAVLFLVFVVLGFHRYFAAVFAGSVQQPSLIHVHAFVSSMWVLLFAVQVCLVGANRTSWHRRLGMLGTLLVVGVVISGYLVAYMRQSAGFHRRAMNHSFFSLSRLRTFLSLQRLSAQAFGVDTTRLRTNG